MTDFGEFLSLSLQSPSVVTSIQYVCYLYEEKKSGSSVNELQYRMFTKKNLSGDCLALTLDALVFICAADSYFFFNYQKYKI